MKAFLRIMLKVFLLLLIIAAAAGGAVGWRTYQRSEPGYIMGQYLTLLLDNETEKAYELLDQSEGTVMSAAEYAEALSGKQYSLNASYTSDELEKRVDNDGNAYADFHVEFKDAEGNVQLTEEFTTKKQPKAAFGIFDQWKVLSEHCMVKNLEITVPTGAQVYLDSQPADTAWIARDGIPYSLDCYRIPSLLPGKKNLVIRHPAFESINTTLDTNAGSQDYSSQMVLKKSAQSECMELGISAIKQLYAAAVKEKTKDLDLFAACQEQAEQFVKDQGSEFHKENHTFQSTAVSKFVTTYGAPVFTEGEDGTITVQLTLGYHYLVSEDVTTAVNDAQEDSTAEEADETQEDSTVEQETERTQSSGDNTATFVMAYRQGAWSIASADVPVIKGNE